MGDESSVSIAAEAWEQALEAEFRASMEETCTAMNAVREGRWIADTEELVRDAGERLRRRALEELLQLRVRGPECRGMNGSTAGSRGPAWGSGNRAVGSASIRRVLASRPSR